MRLLLLAVLGIIVASPTLAAEKPAPAPVKPVAPSTLRVINNSEADTAQVEADFLPGAGATTGPDCKPTAAGKAVGPGCTAGAAQSPIGDVNKPTNGTGGQGGGRIIGSTNKPVNGVGGTGGGRITAPPVKPAGGN